MNDPVERSRQTLRTVRALTILGAMIAGFFFLQPDVTLAMQRLDQDRGRLHSDEVVFATQATIERERTRLLSRHRSIADGEAQSDLMHKLALLARRHSIRVMAIDAATIATSPLQHRGPDGNLDQLRLRIEMRGSYRGLLATIDELARISDAVRIEAPSLHWDGTALGASVPLFILRAHVVNGSDVR